jgi:hypothetical protein
VSSILAVEHGHSLAHPGVSHRVQPEFELQQAPRFLTWLVEPRQEIGELSSRVRPRLAG